MTLQPPQVQTYQPLVQNALDPDTPPHMAPANVRREVESQNDGPPGTGEPPWPPPGAQAPRAAAVTPRGGAAPSEIDDVGPQSAYKKLKVDMIG